MRSLLLSLLALSAVGCSSTPVMEKSVQEKFMRDFSSTNLQIANRYYRNFQQYEGFSQTYWETILDQLSSDSALSLKRDIRAFNVIKAKGFEKGTVICVYSEYFELGFCDNTRCEGTELSGIKKEEEIPEAMARVTAYTCSK
nr:hypothetical protein BHI3_08560 [Bacteriovorax sp. HI3]